MNFWIGLLCMILFVFWAPFLVPFGLTINEELFVFLSFILFVELLGRALADAVSTLADNRRTLIALSLTTVSKRELSSLILLRHALGRIALLESFRLNLMAVFVEELFRLSSQPILDQCFLSSQALYRIYVSSLRMECRLIRHIAQTGLLVGFNLLRKRLFSIPLMQFSSSSVLKVEDCFAILDLGFQLYLNTNFLTYES